MGKCLLKTLPKKTSKKNDEIYVDIYVPHYSKLPIPVEELDSYVTKIENLRTVEPEALLILKQGVEMHRRYSVKGGIKSISPAQKVRQGGLRR